MSKFGDWIKEHGLAAVKTIGDIGANVWNAISQHNTNDQRIELAEQQNNWNLAQWHRQNAYDSPAAQMQRFVDAGLNPNLIYGQMSNGSVAAPAASASGDIQPVGVNNPFDAGVDAALQQELQKQQIESMRIANDNATKKTLQDIAESLKRMELTDQQIENLKLDAMQSSENVLILQKSRFILDEQHKQSILDTYFKKDSYKYNISILASEANISRAHAEAIDKLFLYELLGMEASIKETRSRTHLNYKTAALVSEQANHFKQLALTQQQYNSAMNVKLDKSYMGFKKGTPLYQLQGYMDLLGQHYSVNAASISNQILEFNNHLLRKFGPTKEVFSIIESGSRSFNNISNGILGFRKTFSNNPNQSGNYTFGYNN